MILFSELTLWWVANTIKIENTEKIPYNSSI